LTIVFKVCEWLSQDEYRRIREFADYLGRRGGCSVFVFKPSMLRSSNLKSYVSFLDKIGAEIEEREKLESLLEEMYKVVVDKTPWGYLLRSRSLLSRYLEEYRIQGFIRYSREHRGFIVSPYKIVDVVGTLEKYGFEVVDKSGLLRRNVAAIGFRGELRRYQSEAVEAWLGNSGRGLVVLPTGAGKTVVAIAAMARLGVPTLIIVYTREQLNEWVDKLRRFTDLAASDIGVFYSGEKRVRTVTVATYQSAYRNMDVLWDRFGLLIIDEAHHLPADKFRFIALKSLAPYRLGLTATPYREDGRHEELFSLLGGVVYEKSLEELEEEGYVASFVIVPRLVELSPREREKYRELRRRYLALARGRSVQELVQAAAVGDESARKALQLLGQMRSMLALCKGKMDEAKRIIEEELRKGSKIIVFTQYVRQAEELGKYVGAPVVTGKTDKVRRRMLVELFKRGRYRVIIFTTVGDEGLDVPDANVGIVMSGTSSRRQFIQRLGRLLRPAPGKTARLYYIAVRGTQEEAAMKRVLGELSSPLGLQR